MRGITGPPEVFEGNKGFKDSIAGEFEIDWSAENLEEVTRTIIKKYNAEIHSQSSIEGVLELQTKEGFTGEEIEGIDLEIFDVAYNIIGGGEEGDKLTIRTKEEADHSLLYMVAVAILDGQVLPAQYEPERIRRRDVQSLLKKIRIKPVDELSARFPDEMPCRLTVRLKDGRKFTIEKRDYEGFFTKPMQWKTVAGKFDKLAAPYADDSLRGEIVDAVENLDGIQVSDLMGLLERVNIPGVRSPEPID
jgi:2-methylcitrate dehydratase